MFILYYAQLYVEKNQCCFYMLFPLFDYFLFNPLNANPEKWSNTLKQIVGNLPTICLSVFDHFMNLALKGLTSAVLKLNFVVTVKMLRVTRSIWDRILFENIMTSEILW